MSEHPYSRGRHPFEKPPEGERPRLRSALEPSRERAPALRAQAAATPKAPRLRLGYRVPLAWLAESWERLWPLLWLPATIVIAFVALALFDVVPDLPGWAHVAVLSAFGLAFLYAVIRTVRRFRSPSGGELRRRMELASGLEHRPLAVVDDKLALGTGDPYAEALWRAHVERQRKLVNDLKVGAPRPAVARRDPYALRGAALLALVIAGAVAWGDEDARIVRMFWPSFAATTDQPITVEAWFTPPEYTGQGPRVVNRDTHTGAIEVPDGTRVMIQVHGGRGAARIEIGRQRLSMTEIDGGSQQAEVLLKEKGRLSVRQRGRGLVNWEIRLIEDKKPEIAWAKPPAIVGNNSIRMEYEAKDDYRVAKIRAYIGRRGDAEVIEIQLPVLGSKLAKGVSVQDFTAHRWAGLEVAIVLEAEDDPNQRGKSQVMKITLPERAFRHPVARRIVTYRKELSEDPENVHKVIHGLGAIAANPRAFGGDTTAYMALRLSQARLIRAVMNDGRTDADVERETDRAIREVQALMWETALRIEEGDLARAERELRKLEQELRDLLSQKNVPDKEIQRLLDELQRAMREYAEQLQRDMRENPERYADRDRNSPLADEEQMRQMLERLRDMLNSGDREALERMLSELRQRMEEMRQGRNQQNRPIDPNHPGMQALRELQDLMRRQQQLMDESHRRGQEQREGKPIDPKEMERMQREQADIQRRLQELRQRMRDMNGGQSPQELDQAEREMGDANRQLGQRRPGDAVGPQGRALEQLRRGMGQAMQQLGQRFGWQFNPGNERGPGQPGEPGQWRGAERDPLGRQLNGLGPLDTQDVKVPTEAERKRVQEIIDELRRRAAETGRPQPELEYYERLLRRF
jgi:uncharacterized protein (TIGR02302 family)